MSLAACWHHSLQSLSGVQRAALCCRQSELQLLTEATAATVIGLRLPLTRGQQKPTNNDSCSCLCHEVYRITRLSTAVDVLLTAKTMISTWWAAAGMSNTATFAFVDSSSCPCRLSWSWVCRQLKLALWTAKCCSSLWCLGFNIINKIKMAAEQCYKSRQGTSWLWWNAT